MDAKTLMPAIFKTSLNYILLTVMLILFFWTGEFGAIVALTIAAEFGLFLLSQTPLLQRYLNIVKSQEDTESLRESEKTIINSLPRAEQTKFASIQYLCDQIEKHSTDIGSSEIGNNQVSDILQKLSKFRYEYARILRVKYLLDTRDTNGNQDLDDQISEAQYAFNHESNSSVKKALSQNLDVLKRRKASQSELNDFGRLLEARLSLVRNSVGLIQDKIYKETNVEGISDLVDDLNSNLDVNEELKDYEELLNNVQLEKPQSKAKEIMKNESRSRRITQR